LYDARILTAVRLDVPVVSIGNLTAGGTGKTPFTGEVVRRLQERGLRVGVVSRGYGRASRGTVVVADGEKVLAGPREGGDEPVMLARRHPGTVVVVAGRRGDAGRIAVETFGAQVIVMDDGFQHRALARDVNIVIIDGRMDIRRERLLPAGLRREWLSGLRRADLLAVAKIADEPAARAAAGRLCRWFKGPVAAFTLCTEEVAGVPARGGTLLQPGTPVLAFSGIADHGGFLETARSAGLKLAAAERFDDHHRYTESDVLRLIGTARASGAAAFLTTEKDAVRLDGTPALAGLLRSAAPLYEMRMRVRMVFGEEALSRLLGSLAGVS
jgi:tetraacyldisaccharide 4'-kinase